MKKTILYLMILGAFSCQKVHEGDYRLTTQAEVNAFSSTQITGNLTIYGNTITDLSPLKNLTSIGGELTINSNASLSNEEVLKFRNQINK